MVRVIRQLTLVAIICVVAFIAIHPIDYGKFDAFRPPIATSRRDWALAFVKTFEKQPYDWPLIFDDAIRYLTSWIPKWLGGPWHLPVVYISNSERIKKICSSLVVRYFNKAKWGPRLTPNASPEDIYIAVRNYAVGG